MNKIIKEILRYLAMKELTGNLGSVVYEDDKLICYVNKRNSKRECLTDYFYCHGINDSNRNLANAYNLNKPITYVFDKLNFQKNNVVIYGYNDANIIIKNCNFNRELIITNPKGITVLDNTIINPFLNLSFTSSLLILMDMNVKNPMDLIKLDILLYGDDIQIINSKIGDEFKRTNIN